VADEALAGGAEDTGAGGAAEYAGGAGAGAEEAGGAGTGADGLGPGT
jgi:hypothetical protein